jgi:hypothetical protein
MFSASLKITVHACPQAWMVKLVEWASQTLVNIKVHRL